MVHIKTRYEGTFSIDKSKGEGLKKSWEYGELPKVVEINGTSFLSRDILSIKEDNEDREKRLEDMSEEELKVAAKKYMEAYRRYKDKPDLTDVESYEAFIDKEEVKIAYYAGVAEKDPRSGKWIPKTDQTDEGKPTLQSFLDFNKSYKANRELERMNGIEHT